MSGWRTSKDVIDLRDEILEKLNAATPLTRQHAWYWISFHMNVMDEIEERDSSSPMDDDTLDWLRKHPERFAKHKEVYERVVAAYEKRLEHARAHLARLG